MIIFWVLLSGLIFLGAYSFGKFQGHKDGLEKGKAIMMLELREQSLIEGCCFFCGTRKQHISNKKLVNEDTE